MPPELISVIVPVYNAEKYLHRCVESIVSQSYPHLEVILVDDGSTDNSGKICDDLATKDSRLRVIHKQNDGASSARNVALNVCGGKYVAFVDSDDYLPLDAYDHLINGINGDNVDLVVGNLFFDGGKTPDTNIQDKELDVNFDGIFELIDNNIFSTSCNKLYRKELIGDKRFDEKMTFSEDLLFNLEYFKYCHKVKTIGQKVYYRYDNSNSVVNSFRKDAFNNQKIAVQYVYDYFKDISLTREQRNKLGNFASNCILPVFKTLLLSNLTKQEKRQLFDEYRKDTLFMSLKSARKSAKNSLIYFLVSHNMFGLISFLYKIRGKR